MTKKHRTPSEDYLNERLEELDRTAKMDVQLNKYGTKTPSGGRVWTVGDMQRFFADSAKKRRKR